MSKDIPPAQSQLDLVLAVSVNSRRDSDKAREANEHFFGLICKYLDARLARAHQDDRNYGQATAEAITFLDLNPAFARTSADQLRESPVGRQLLEKFRDIFVDLQLATTHGDSLRSLFCGKGGKVLVRGGLATTVDGAPPPKSLQNLIAGIQSYLLDRAQMVNSHALRSLTDEEVVTLFHYFLKREERNSSKFSEWIAMAVTPSFRKRLQLQGIDPSSLPNQEIEFSLSDGSNNVLAESADGEFSWHEIPGTRKVGVVSNSLTVAQKRQLVTTYFRLFDHGLEAMIREVGLTLKSGIRLSEELLTQLASLNQQIQGIKDYLSKRPQTDQKLLEDLDELLKGIDFLANRLANKTSQFSDTVFQSSDQIIDATAQTVS